MKKKILILFILFSEYSFSQEILFPIGYVYNQQHNLHLGIDLQLTKETLLIVGVSGNTTFNGGKIKLTPELHANIIPFSSENKSIFLSMIMAEIATTKDYFNPNLGFSIFNIAKLKAGYNFPYKNDYQDNKGITLGLVFSLGSMNSFSVM